LHQFTGEAFHIGLLVDAIVVGMVAANDISSVSSAPLARMVLEFLRM
jgi:hypothetical protein